MNRVILEKNEYDMLMERANRAKELESNIRNNPVEIIIKSNEGVFGKGHYTYCSEICISPTGENIKKIIDKVMSSHSSPIKEGKAYVELLEKNIKSFIEDTEKQKNEIKMISKDNKELVAGNKKMCKKIEALADFFKAFEEETN